MKATEHVSAARRNLVLDHPFFGVLSLKLELVEDSSVPSFRTDGRQLRFNPEFALGLNRYEAQGVVAHEVLHCANGHVWRRGSRDPKVWNLACDYAINPMLLLKRGWSCPQARSTVLPTWNERRRDLRTFAGTTAARRAASRRRNAARIGGQSPTGGYQRCWLWGSRRL